MESPQRTCDLSSSVCTSRGGHCLDYCKAHLRLLLDPLIIITRPRFPEASES